MNDVIDRELRDVARAFADTAPASPELPELEGSVRRRRSAKGTGLVAVAALLIAVVGIATALVVHSFEESSPAAYPSTSGPDGWIVIMYFDTEVPNDGAVKALEARTEVADMYLVSKSQAYEEGLDIFADDEAMLDVLAENPGILPSRISVRTTTDADATAIVRFAEGLDGVVHVEAPFYGQINAFPWSSNSGDDPPMSADSEFLSEPTEQGPIMVFFAAEPTQERRNETLNVLRGNDGSGGWAGYESSEAQMRRLRSILEDDNGALQLLDQYPQIVTPYVVFDPAVPGMDNQPVLDTLGLSTDFSNIYTVTGSHPQANIFHPTEVELPAAAARLRAWWRAELFAEMRTKCCGGPDAFDDLRLRPAVIELGEELVVEHWRTFTATVCNVGFESSTANSPDPEHAQQMQLAGCRERIPWRQQPPD